MGALPLSGLNLNRNQTGQSGPYCKLRPTRVPYFDFGNSGALGKGLVYASSFILLARICVHASSFAFLARIRVCFIVLIESIRHHSVGPCLQLGDPSERDDPSLCIGRSPRQLMLLARGSQNLSMNHFVTGGIHGWIRRGS